MSKKLIRPSQHQESDSEKKRTLIVLLLVFLSILFFGFKLIREVFGGADFQNVRVGRVSHQENFTQRRSADSSLWQNLREQSTVYNFDRLSTSSNGFTTLTMNDGTEITLGPNTLAVINWNEKERSVQLEQGNITLDSNTDVLLKTSAGNIEVDQYSQVFMQNTAEGSLAMTLAGAALLNGKMPLESGNQVYINADATEQDFGYNPFLKPLNNDVYFTDETNKASVNFVASEAKTHDGVIEINNAYDFKGQSFDMTSSSSIMLEQGVYFWRYRYADDKFSPVFRFLVTEAVKPVIKTRDNIIFQLNKENPTLTLNWETSALNAYYVVEVALDQDFNNVIKKEQTSLTQITFSGLPENKYYYRVTAYSLQNKIGISSQAQQFSVNMVKEMILPVLLKPENNHYFNRQDIRTMEIFFNWSVGSNFSNPTLVIAKDPDFRDIVLKTSPTLNFTRLMVPTSTSLYYYWRLEGTDQNNSPVVTPPNRYSFLSQEPIETLATIKSEVSSSLPVSETNVTSINQSVEQRIEIPTPTIPREELYVRPAQPAANQQINGIKEARINFTWQSNINSFFDLEIARDQDFKEPVQTIKRINGLKIEVTTPSAEGDYFWRLRYTQNKQNHYTPTRQFSIKWVLPKVDILVPKPNAVFETLEVSKGLIFKWVAPKVKNYTISIAKDEEFTSIVYTKTGPEPSSPIPRLGEGTYFLKLTGEALNGDIYPPNVISFKVKPYVLAAPEALNPAGQTVINMTHEKSLNFSWEAASDATDTTLTLYKIDAKSQSGYRIIHSKTLIRGNSYQLPRLNLLEEGDYLWSIQSYSRSAGGNMNSTSEKAEGRFTLTLDPLPVIKPTSPSRFQYSLNPAQKIEWAELAGVSRYRILVVTNDAKKLKISDSYASATSTILRLRPGNYLLTVTPLNIFGKPANEGVAVPLVIAP